MTKVSTKKLYKFLREGLKSDNGKNRDWIMGEWRKEDNISICNAGFHASKTPLQAFGYVQGEILAQVEVRGEHITGDDKECWSEMRIIKAWRWQKKDSASLAIYAAELCLDNFEKKYPDDKRPREAIEAARRVLADDSEKNVSAAKSAAWSAESAAKSAAESAKSAAKSAAWSAESAAKSAAESAKSAAWSAESAAKSAAWSAAKSAAWSAESAAWSAKKKLIAPLDTWFIKRIKTLEPWMK